MAVIGDDLDLRNYWQRRLKHFATVYNVSSMDCFPGDSLLLSYQRNDERTSCSMNAVVVVGCYYWLMAMLMMTTTMRMMSFLMWVSATVTRQMSFHSFAWNCVESCFHFAEFYWMADQDCNCCRD